MPPNDWTEVQPGANSNSVSSPDPTSRWLSRWPASILKLPTIPNLIANVGAKTDGAPKEIVDKSTISALRAYETDELGLGLNGRSWIRAQKSSPQPHRLGSHSEHQQGGQRSDQFAPPWKTLPNHVATVGPDGQQIGIVFETATPFDTPQLMQELFEWLAREEREPVLHPLLRIAVFNVVFLAIHPFQDGNGRLSSFRR